jgi:hypothetical protein
MWNRLEQHFLHGIFSILALTADPHAKGEHSILEQGQGLLQSGVVTRLQELHSLFDLRTHCVECSTLSLDFTNCFVSGRS